MKKILAVLIGSFVLSTQVFAATARDSQQASRAGKNEQGVNCLFSYQITKEGPTSVKRHQDIIYKLRLDNLGSCDLRNVVLEDHLSKRVRFLEATPGFYIKDNRIIWKDIRIEDGRSKIFFVKVEPRTERDAEVVNNTAKAFSRQVGQSISATISTIVFKH